MTALSVCGLQLRQRIDNGRNVLANFRLAVVERLVHTKRAPKSSIGPSEGAEAFATGMEGDHGFKVKIWTALLLGDAGKRER